MTSKLRYYESLQAALRNLVLDDRTEVVVVFLFNTAPRRPNYCLTSRSRHAALPDSFHESTLAAKFIQNQRQNLAFVDQRLASAFDTGYENPMPWWQKSS
jgi:hypothetical protein